jgi:hypothetical protein
LKKVFYRGYGKYYFERRLKDVENAKSEKEANEICGEIYRWRRVWYKEQEGTIHETLTMIKQIGEMIISGSKGRYTDDDNPDVEVCRLILIVPYWRIMFEYKRIMIDKRLEKEKLEKEKTQREKACQFSTSSC